MTVNSIVVVSCEVAGVGLVDLRVMVLELDSSFRVFFYLELGGVDEWTSSVVVSMMDVTGGFLGFFGLMTCLG